VIPAREKEKTQLTLKIPPIAFYLFFIVSADFQLICELGFIFNIFQQICELLNAIHEG